MTTKKFLNIIFTIMLSTCSALSAVTQAANTAAMPDLNVSQDQMQKMEVMMNEMQNFYENLSPEEKSQFEKELASEVEKEQKKLESMAPAAQKQYIETAFKAFDDIDIDQLIEELSDTEMADNSRESKEDKPADKATASKNAENEKAENKKKIKDTLDLINNIIKVLNNLNQKLNGIKPSAQDLVDKWIRKGSIQKWAGQKSSWNLFNKDLQAMKQRLEKLKQADPKTGKYYYLNDMKTVEKLYGQLEMLYSKIKKYESSIEINASTGQMKNEAAKSALIGLINYLADITKTIIKNADEIISKFEKSDATKIKSEEEKKAETAKTTRKPRAGETKSAGRAQRYDEDTYKYSPYAVDAPTSYYGSTYPSSNYGSGDRPDTSFGSSSSGKSDTSSAGIAGSSGKSAGISPTTLTDSSDSKKKDLLASDDKINSLQTADAPQNATKGVATTQVEISADKKMRENIKKKYPEINRQLSSITSELGDLIDSYKKVTEDAIWKNKKVNSYLQGVATYNASQSKSFDNAVEKALSNMQKATESVKEFVEAVNKNVKAVDQVDKAAKKYFKDKALKRVEEYKDIEKEIVKEVEVLRGSDSNIRNKKTKVNEYENILKLKDISKIRKEIEKIK